MKEASEAERADLVEKIKENEFVILELNSSLEEEVSLVVDLENRLQEHKRNVSMQESSSGDGTSDVLLARIQLLDEHISDLESELEIPVTDVVRFGVEKIVKDWL